VPNLGSKNVVAYFGVFAAVEPAVLASITISYCSSVDGQILVAVDWLYANGAQVFVLCRVLVFVTEQAGLNDLPPN